MSKMGFKLSSLTLSNSFGSFEYTYNATCDRMIEHRSDQLTTGDALALANNVPSAAILYLNDVMAYRIEPGSYCAPLPCEVAVIDGQEATSANNFVDRFDNITLTQFWAWNLYMNSKNLRPGEIMCIG
jgi:hypothetical protein